MATGALASIICLLLITGSKALTFPNFSGNPAFPSFPSGTGAAPGDTVAPASPPAAPPSIAIGALTQPSSPPVGIGTGMNLNAVTKNVNFFKNLTDGFSEINFNYAEDGTANAFSERACMDDCVQNPDCVMVLWCEKAAEAPTSLGVMPGSLGGISVGPRSNFECKIFKESATGAQQSETSETTSQWTSKCKYLQINPVCKNITPKTGWMTVGKATVSTDHTLSQIYDCSSGYRKETNINSITCDKTGVIEETGSCTLAMSVNPITETSAAGELPALGSAGPVGSAGSAGSVLSNLITQNLPSFSSRDVNECLDGNPCGDIPNSDCHNTQEGYECLCHEGFTKEVTQCVDIDECLDGSPCVDISNSDCVNTQGNYECQCHEGFAKVDNTCVDINECELENICPAGHDCNNIVGSYECKDVDECLTEDICSTGHVCTNTAGSYECSDVNECLTEDICSTGHVCTNTAGSYECSDVDECLTEDICSTGHVCTNTAGSYECNDVDECLTEDICSTGHLCTNTAGSYECSDIDECTDENSCGENSVCDNTEGGYVCHCLDGFTKVENECVALEPLPVTQPPTSSETEDSCPDNEYFKSETNGCECVAGYERLSYGSSCTDVNECEAESICPAGHVCTNIDGDYECRVSENPADICEARGFTYDAETNFCFKYLDDFKTQEKAKNTCEVDFDARLATVNTHGKIRAIEDYLKRPDTPWGFYMWIDGEQEYTVWMYDLYYYGYFFYYWYPVEGVAWSDSSLVASDLFQYDPNNNFAKCTEIDPVFYDYKFAEWECDYQQPFVCEIPVKNCPAPFQYDEDSHFCYKFENVVVYYEEQAWVECNKIGARLAVTNTQRKIDVVKAAADATTRNTNYDGSYFPIIVAAWFDTYDYFEGREVNTWYDGSHVRWDLFKTGQPNFIFGDCVAIDGNKLQDIYCYDMFEYVCEIPQ